MNELFKRGGWIVHFHLIFVMLIVNARVSIFIYVSTAVMKHYGEIIMETMSCSYRLNLHLLAIGMANAANKSLRCFELPGPDYPTGPGTILLRNLLVTA